ncbi:MAG: hypothetical protein ACEPOZ_13115 [Marinifilaceae bacterium]
MKIISPILVFLTCFVNALPAQEITLPLEMKGSHLSSQWQLNSSIGANVFLETGFPKVVFNEIFVKEHLIELNVKMVEAPENKNISLWGGNRKYKVSYLINDTITINGKRVEMDALVVDFTPIKAWKNYDIIYPILDLKGRIEINIKDRYMKILDSASNLPEGFHSYKVNKDKDTKGLYLSTNLRVYDTLGGKEELSGNFLLDLGAGNAFMLNKNRQEVLTFVQQTDRMHLKDSTRIPSPGKRNLSIIMPQRIEIDNIEIKGTFIPALKFFASKKSNKYVGCIGNKFFRNFVLIFDFENSTIYLKPNTDRIVMLK